MLGYIAATDHFEKEVLFICMMHTTMVCAHPLSLKLQVHPTHLDCRRRVVVLCYEIQMLLPLHYGLVQCCTTACTQSCMQQLLHHYLSCLMVQIVQESLCSVVQVG